MHHRRRRRNRYLKPIIIGLAVLVIGGGEGLLYQQLRGPKVYTFDPTAFADITESQELVQGTLTAQITCTNPVVISELDSAAMNPDTLDQAGRPVTNGTFKTVMNKETSTYLRVYDDVGTLCLAGNFRPAAGKVTITPQLAAASFNPFQFDVFASSSSVNFQALPSHNAFQGYLATALATNLLTQVVASPQYEVFLNQLQAELASNPLAPEANSGT